MRFSNGRLIRKSAQRHPSAASGNGLSSVKATVFRSRRYVLSCGSAGVVGIEAGVEVLDKPDRTSRKAGPAVGAGTSGRGRPGGYPFGQDAGDRQGTDDRS